MATLLRCAHLALVVAATNLGAQFALAANAENGKRLAQTRCAPCHIVIPNQRQELAASPTFEQIAKNNAFNGEMLAYLILSPHPRMNMTITPDEADDIANYILSLRK